MVSGSDPYQTCASRARPDYRLQTAVVRAELPGPPNFSTFPFGEFVPQLVPDLGRESLQPLHHLGMLRSEIGGLSQVLLQVEELQSGLGLIVGDRVAAGPSGSTRQGSVFVGKVKLPAAVPHGLQLTVPIIRIEDLVRRASPRFREHQGSDVPAIDLVSGQHRTDQSGDRGKDIDRRGQFVALRTRRDPPRPAHQGGDPDSPFERRALALPEWSRGPGVIPVAEPGPVVGSEDHQSVPVQIGAFQGIENLSHGPVDLHDDVAKQTSLTAPLELVGYVERDMDHAVRQVQQEGPIPVSLDEIHGALGVLGREQSLVFPRDLGIDDLVALDQGQIGKPIPGGGVLGPHVIGIGEAVVLVEAILQRQELGMVAQMPFPEAGRGITLASTQFPEGDFLLVDADVGTGSQSARQAESAMIAAGHQGRPGCRAHRRRNLEVRESHALCRHAVQIGCRVTLGAEGADVGIPHVVNENQNDVGRAGFRSVGWAGLRTPGE